jgi:hypothetical protein
VIPALLGIVLAGLGLWILQPLRGARRVTPPGGVDDGKWKELVDAKHAVYRSIIDLEFDRSVGKVAEEDYGILRHQHEMEALAILHEMDAMAAVAAAAGDPAADPAGDPAGAPSPPGAPQDTLEAEIAAARERLRPTT